jgi:Rps23 Pro-64 3,4-dihydroxylase Tpa1-like proline 4-hydroxylase
MCPTKSGFPDAAKNILNALSSYEVLNYLETLTGINGLIPDPYFHGAGLQQTMNGGSLGIHIDFNKYEKLKLDRRLNVLIYLNKDWNEEWGGHLELWNNNITKCVKKTAPEFNRCVIFPHQIFLIMDFQTLFDALKE